MKENTVVRIVSSILSSRYIARPCDKSLKLQCCESNRMSKHCAWAVRCALQHFSTGRRAVVHGFKLCAQRFSCKALRCCIANFSVLRTYFQYVWVCVHGLCVCARDTTYPQCWHDESPSGAVRRGLPPVGGYPAHGYGLAQPLGQRQPPLAMHRPSLALRGPILTRGGLGPY
jgi:hypothetical protein